MKHPVIAICLAGIALTASSFTTASADSGSPLPSIEILVDGRIRPVYIHEGRWYVEALKGREYAIRIRNPYDVRVAVALAVDGLNTIDARETTARGARKWVLRPYETATISGWQTSQTTARRFEFTSEAQSYGAALGKVRNLGVISAVFFKEKHEFKASARGRLEARRVPAPQAPSAESRDAAATAEERRESESELAATGMGKPTDHAVTQVWLDLEDVAAHSVSMRYEFRSQLVQLGVLPSAPVNDALARRERARGFQPEFAPVPPHLR